MTAENTMHAETLVTFTISLPQNIAGKIIARAEEKNLVPETWLQEQVPYLLAEQDRQQTGAQNQNSTAETNQSGKTLKSPALELIRTRLSRIIMERERAENRLFDIRHTVQTAEDKKAEYDAVQKTLEGRIKTLLDEIIDRPYDKELLVKLDGVTGELNAAKYQHSLLAAQYEDALGCFLAQNSAVMKIHSQYRVLQAEYGTLLRKAAEQEGEMK